MLCAAGGAGQKSAFPGIEGDLWDAAQQEVSIDMPEAHESNERGQMAQEGLAGASPSDQTTFPSNVEDQVHPPFLSCRDWKDEILGRIQEFPG